MLIFVVKTIIDLKGYKMNDIYIKEIGINYLKGLYDYKDHSKYFFYYNNGEIKNKVSKEDLQEYKDHLLFQLKLIDDVLNDNYLYITKDRNEELWNKLV